MTTQLSFQPPTGDLFAAVEVHATADAHAAPDSGSWRVVGAQPAFRIVPRPTGRMIEVDGEQVQEMERVMVPASSVAVDCKLQPADELVRCAWVHEDSSRGLEWTQPHPPHEKPRRRR